MKVEHVTYMILMAAVAALVFMLMIFGEEGAFLPNAVAPAVGIPLNAWLSKFRLWSTVIIGAALLASLLWYILGQWIFKVNQGKDAGKRLVWFCLVLIPLAAIIAGIILTPAAQAGILWAYLFYVLNGLLVYYFATALFSPSAFKYSPPGASKLRRW